MMGAMDSTSKGAMPRTCGTTVDEELVCDTATWRHRREWTATHLGCGRRKRVGDPEVTEGVVANEPDSHTRPASSTVTASQRAGLSPLTHAYVLAPGVLGKHSVCDVAGNSEGASTPDGSPALQQRAAALNEVVDDDDVSPDALCHATKVTTSGNGGSPPHSTQSPTACVRPAHSHSRAVRTSPSLMVMIREPSSTRRFSHTICDPPNPPSQLIATVSLQWRLLHTTGYSENFLWKRLYAPSSGKATAVTQQASRVLQTTATASDARATPERSS
jgi:hypothetical protein